MGLAEMIAKLRKKHGFSQEELGEKLAVSRQAVSKWESGQTVPELEKLKEMCRIFGISMDELLGETPPEEKGGEPEAEQKQGGLSSAEVAAIVRQEVGKLSRPPAKKKMPLWTAAALFFMAVLTVVTQLQYNSLKEQMGNLRGSVDSVKNELSNTVGTLRHSIQQSLEEQSSLISRSAYTFVELDPAKQKAVIRFTVTPKKMTDDTAIRVVLSSDRFEPISCMLSHKGNAVFEGETEVPFAEPIYHGIIIEQDGSTFTEEEQAIYDLNKSYELTLDAYPQEITYSSKITIGEVFVDVFCQQTYDESFLNAPMKGMLRFYVDEQLLQETELDFFRGQEPDFTKIKEMIENFSHVSLSVPIEHTLDREGWETARCEIEVTDRFGIRYGKEAFVITPKEPTALSTDHTEITYPE